MNPIGNVDALVTSIALAKMYPLFLGIVQVVPLFWFVTPEAFVRKRLASTVRDQSYWWSNVMKHVIYSKVTRSEVQMFVNLQLAKM